MAKLFYKSLCPSVCPSVANDFPIALILYENVKSKHFTPWNFSIYLFICVRQKDRQNRHFTIVLKFYLHMPNCILRAYYSCRFFNLSLLSQARASEDR